MTRTSTISSLPFKTWIRKDSENNVYLIMSGIFSILAFIWLKMTYPHPNFLPDSYSYLDAAFNNQDINMWPIGYSKFLRLFSSFTRSDIALVFVQYILLQASVLYFLFTIRYLLSPGKWLFRILSFCCIVNPISLYVSNFISSDALFATLSLVWFTQLLWILYRPGVRLLILHALVLLLAFSVRYNALYYPLISLALIGLTHMSISKKIIGIGSMLLLLGGFVGFNLYKSRQLTGSAQFSAFGGWQMASNALFAYAHADPDSAATVPAKFRELQGIVIRHMDSLSRLTIRPDKELGIYYLWDDHAPLKEYLIARYRKDSVTDGYKRWSSMGPIYSAYGGWLIGKHPLVFIGHYLLPNIVNYYVPSPEFMNIYNMGKDTVEDLAKFWFNYKTNKVTVPNKQIGFMDSYPIALAIINLVFVLSFVSFWLLEGFKKSGPYPSKALKWMGCIWLANFGFSVLASPIVLRYQVFPMLITFAFLGILIEFIHRESRATKPIKHNNHEHESPNILNSPGGIIRLR